MNLSPNFTLAELTRSQAARRHGLKNTPGPAAVANLRRLADLLEDVRLMLKRPVFVTSAYRAPAVNRRVGGSATSAHCFGLAADLEVPGLSPSQVAAMLAGDKKLMAQVDQLILEFPPGGWVHLGLAKPGRAPRRQVLTATRRGGKVVYLPGLP